MMSGQVFRCPRCGAHERPENELARRRLQGTGRCQGCRAREALVARPSTLPLFLEFWRKFGFPSSPSWMEGVQGPPAPPWPGAFDGRCEREVAH